MQSGETVIVTESESLVGRKLCERLSSTYDLIELSSDEGLREALRAIQERPRRPIASVVHASGSIEKTSQLLRFLKHAEVQQFILLSSMRVHAPCAPGQRINEEWPLDQDDQKSEIEIEDVVRREKDSVPGVVLRTANVYDDQCHSAPLAHQIQRIYERHLSAHVFPGDLSHGQPFLHAVDLIELVARLISKRAELPPDLTLLAGEPDTLSYNTLQRELIKLIHHVDWVTYRIPKPLAKAGEWSLDDHYELDVSRAKNWTGWEPRHALGKTLPLMIAEFKKDPMGWYAKNKLTPPLWLKDVPPLNIFTRKLERRHTSGDDVDESNKYSRI